MPTRPSLVLGDPMGGGEMGGRGSTWCSSGPKGPGMARWRRVQARERLGSEGLPRGPFLKCTLRTSAMLDAGGTDGDRST